MIYDIRWHTAYMQQLVIIVLTILVYSVFVLRCVWKFTQFFKRINIPVYINLVYINIYNIYLHYTLKPIIKY